MSKLRWRAEVERHLKHGLLGLQKDVRALAKQQEILLKRWGDLHDRIVELEGGEE